MVFVSRVGHLLSSTYSNIGLFRDDNFRDTSDGMVQTFKFVSDQNNEASSCILKLDFEVKDGIIDHGFLVCTDSKQQVMRIPTGKHGSNLTNKNADSLVSALGVL